MQDVMVEMATVGYPTVAVGFPTPNGVLDVSITDIGVSIGVVFVAGQYWIQVTKAGHNNYVGRDGNLNFFTVMQEFKGGWNTELEALQSQQWFRLFNSNPQLMGS
jgi:hypothetical protein